MSEPLNTRTLRHFLDFKSDGTGMLEIDEPVGFDSANFIIEQREDGYGRDISFAGGDTEFTFAPQKNQFGHHFDLLLEYDSIYGFEADVEYILREGSVDYIVGQVDFQTKQTDEILYFSCTIIQSSQQALLKRREDISVNLFSDLDLDNNSITPIETVNVLLKAKPVYQESEWFTPNEIAFGTGALIVNDSQFFNGMYAIKKYGVNDSLSWLPNGTPGSDHKLILAESNLSNVNIDISDVTFVRGRGSGNVSLYYRIGADYASSDEVLIQNFGDSASNYSTTLSFDFISSGFSLWLYFKDNSPSIDAVIVWQGGVTKINAVSTFIDSVTKMARLKDVTKKISESIDSNYNVVQPRFEQGGEWYDNFVFSGNMLRGRDRFNLSWSDLVGGLTEFHADYEVEGNNIFVGKYDDYYTNNEVGAFLIKPNADFKTTFNERYTINQFNFNYTEFDQDKDNENTIDGLHTETQWLLPNKLVENNKEVEAGFVRDPFLIESTRRKALEETTTSVTEDDDVFVMDCVPLSPTAQGGFTALLNHQWTSEEGELKLLNDGTFNWALLGFSVGSLFTVSSDLNEGVYTVTAIERTLLTLTIFTSNDDPFSGESVTRVLYPLDNVSYVNRTNEGFDSITGLVEGNNYSNLLYTPKRNIINNYGSYLSTATKYKKDIIKNTYFKNWTDEETPVITDFGGDVVNEISDLTQDDLADPILTPRIIDTKVLCDFGEYREYAQLLKSKRGFVRVYNQDGKVLRGFVKNSDFLWAENSLTLTLEEMQESEITNITYINDMFYINRVGYTEDLVPELVYKGTENKYIQFYDIFSRPLTNKLRFDYVSVDGFTYDSLVDLSIAIDELNG